jgi:hypothetical protein
MCLAFNFVCSRVSIEHAMGKDDILVSIELSLNRDCRDCLFTRLSSIILSIPPHLCKAAGPYFTQKLQEFAVLLYFLAPSLIVLVLDIITTPYQKDRHLFFLLFHGRSIGMQKRRRKSSSTSSMFMCLDGWLARF